MDFEEFKQNIWKEINEVCCMRIEDAGSTEIPAVTENSSNEYYFEKGLRCTHKYSMVVNVKAKKWKNKQLKQIFANGWNWSPDRLQQEIELKHIEVEGITDLRPETFLCKGDLVRVRKEAITEDPVSGKPLQFIAVTSELIAMDKPAAMPCVPCGNFFKNSVTEILKREFGYEEIYNIHSIDLCTSGLFFVARNKQARAFFQERLEQYNTVKLYLAQVYGHFPEEQFKTMGNNLLGGSNKSSDDANGDYAKSLFYGIAFDQGSNTSLVLCRIYTGRTHQIRVHLSLLGFPIVGDVRYSTASKKKIKRAKRANNPQHWIQLSTIHLHSWIYIVDNIKFETALPDFITGFSKYDTYRAIQELMCFCKAEQSRQYTSPYQQQQPVTRNSVVVRLPKLVSKLPRPPVISKSKQKHLKELADLVRKREEKETAVCCATGQLQPSKRFKRNLRLKLRPKRHLLFHHQLHCSPRCTGYYFFTCTFIAALMVLFLSYKLVTTN